MKQIKKQAGRSLAKNKRKEQNNISQDKSKGKGKKKLQIKSQTSSVIVNASHDIVWDTIIVGAGASGMAAALVCGKQGQKVLLLERQGQMGRKILVTGNGKCNLTNFTQGDEYYQSECPEKVKRILSVFGQKEAMELFQSLGIYTKNKNGYVYPYSEQAASVREAFEEEIISDPNITFVPFSEVCDIEKKSEVFSVKVRESRENSEVDIKTNCEGIYRCRSILVTTGGLAGPKFGCDGSGYPFAKKFGHKIIKPLPALTALKSSAPFLKKVSGVRNQAAIILEIDGTQVRRETGELQWTDYGISGVAIFQLSRFAITALEEKKKVSLYFDFMPELSLEEKHRLFLMLASSNKDKTVLSFAKGLFPAKLCPVILREARIDEKVTVGSLKEQEWDAFITAVSHFSLRINGYAGYEKAQVTRGGVSLEQLTDSMESVFKQGLFFAGEITDVDGSCGGYNLQWAFSSGTVAGRAIVQRNQRIAESGYGMTEEKKNQSVSERNQNK